MMRPRGSLRNPENADGRRGEPRVCVCACVHVFLSRLFFFPRFEASCVYHSSDGNDLGASRIGLRLMRGGGGVFVSRA